MKTTEYNKDCPCTRKRCVRHGKCRECRAHHAGKRLRPQCENKQTIISENGCTQPEEIGKTRVKKNLDESQI